MGLMDRMRRALHGRMARMSDDGAVGTDAPDFPPKSPQSERPRMNEQDIPQGAKRVDIISDTHGHLSDQLLDAIKGADLVIHAGDLTSEEDYEHLKALVPLKAVLGNNDYYHDYGPEVERLSQFTYEGLRFAVAHYREDLPTGAADVAVCGHTHRSKISQAGRCLVINTGSASFPRGSRTPSIARLIVRDGAVLSADIIPLDPLW